MALLLTSPSVSAGLFHAANIVLRKSASEMSAGAGCSGLRLESVSSAAASVLVRLSL